MQAAQGGLPVGPHEMEGVLAEARAGLRGLVPQMRAQEAMGGVGSKPRAGCPSGLA